MKAIHRSRIDGLIILALVIGVISGKFLGWTALLMLIPVTMLWFFEYEIKGLWCSRRNRNCFIK